MANGGQIRYNVGFNIDKTGLNELTKILQNVQTELAKSGSMGKTEAEIQKTITAAKQLEGVLNSAWNSKLNQLDLSKVSSGIKSTFGSVQQLKAQMEASGSSGAAAYNKVASAVLNTNLQLKQSNKLLDDMADTMAKTVKWGITSSIFNRITGSIQEAWGYTKRLDSSLNDIRIVTDKSAESMQKFAKQANEAAKALGKGTVDYTDASLIYYQQGLSDEEVAARAEVTLKAANVTGQSTEEVSEQLTAVWNGYKISAQEAELYVDKLAAVAASTAADLEELSIGMSKVASAANSMGVDIDQLNAQLATIVSVTRQAPESVGTALKTIYARLGDLAIDGEDEFGVALGTVSKQMEEMGIQILDEQGQMRDMGEVIEETAAKWDTWSEAQRQAAAVAMAGKRQYNNLIALFDNWDMYTDALNTSVDATGTLQKQQDIYMESMEAHLEQMTAEAERTYDVLFNEETIKDFSSAITSVLGVFNDFIEGIGGGGKALLYFGTIAVNVFNKQITAGIQKSIQNFQAWQANMSSSALKEEYIKTGVAKDNAMSGTQISDAVALKAQYKIAGDMLKVQKGLTVEQQQQYIEIQRQVGLNVTQLANIRNRKDEAFRLLENEEATLLMAQAREKIEKENLIEQKQAQAVYKENLMLIEKEGSTWANKKALMQSITALNSTLNLDAKEQLITEAAKKDILEQGRVSETNRLQLEELINSKISAQKQFHADIVNLVKLMEAYENGETEELKEQIKLLLRKKDILDQSGKSSMNLQKGISGTMAAAQGLVSIMGALPTIMDETAGKAEVTQAGFSMASGLATAIGSAFGPVGMAVGMVGSSIISTAGSMITKKIKEEEEELERLAQAAEDALEEAYDKLSQTQENITSFKEVEAEWSVLVSGVDEYGNNLSLTNDEYERYLDICTMVDGISSDLIEGYTKEGQAILTKRDAIQEVIDKLKEQEIIDKRVSVSGTNRDTAIDQAQKAYENEKNAHQGTLDNRMKDVGNALSDWGYTTTIGTSISTYKGQEAIEHLIKEFLDYAESEYATDEFKDRFAKILEDGILTDQEFVENFEELTDWYAEKTKGLSSAAMGASVTWIGEENQIAESMNKAYEVIDKYVSQVESDQVAINAALTDLQDTLETDLFYGTEERFEVYSNLTKEQVELIRGYIDDFQIDPNSEMGWEDQYNNYLNDTIAFMEEINSLDKNITEIATKLKDPSNFTSKEEYTQAVEEVKQGIQNLPTEAKIRIWDMIGFETADDGEVIETTVEEAIRTINEVYQKNMDTLPKAGIAAFLEGNDASVFPPLIESPEEIIAYAEYLKTLNGEVNASTYEIFSLNTAVETLSLTTDELKTGIETAGLALDEFKEKGEFSKETLELLETTKGYERLAEIQDKTSHKYLATIREIREEQENAYLANLEHEKGNLEKLMFYYQDMADKGLMVEADVSKYEETMQKLLETEYAIQVHVEADLMSDVDSAFGLADEFEKLQEFISDDLKISLDTAEEYIENGFGDILLNAEHTTEGMMQLNADSVNAFIEGKRLELDNDKKAKLEQLENQRNILLAQKEALLAKIAALDEAAAAENAIDANTAIQKAQNADSEYQAAVLALNEENKKVAEASTENENINEQLYNALGGMYEQDSINLQQAEIDATNTNQQEINTRIQNVGKLYAAYQQLANQIRASESGRNLGNIQLQHASGGGNVSVTGSEEVQGQGTYTAQETSAEDLTKLIENLFTSGGAEEGSQYQQTITAAREAAKEHLKSLELQLGAVDGAIAALKTSGTTLTEMQAGIGEISGDANEKTADTEELLEKVYDRYYDINIQLDLLDTNLSRIQKTQEKLTGKAYIQNLQQQLDILNKQIEANRTKLSLTETEMAEVMAMLSSKGTQFNDAGQVTNYKAVMDQALADANAVINTYNSMSAEQQETYKATMEAAKESYDALVSTFERFDELYTEEIPGLVDTIQEALDQAVELKIEQFNTEIQITLDLKQAEREWNEFQANVLRGLKDDDLVGQANLGMAQWDTYYGKNGTNTISTDIAKLEELNNQASQMLGGNFGTIYGDNFAKLYEDMQAATQQLMTDMEAAQEVADGIYNNYLESIDKVIEGNDAVVEQYEYINGLLDHNVKLVELLGANEKSSMLAEQYAQRNTLNQQMVSEHLANAQYYEKMMNSIDDKTSEEWQKWHDAWQKEVESLNSSIITAMEDAAEAYANAIDVAMQEMESAFTDGMGFDYIQDEWDLVNENADKYLDTINAAYEISSLENKFVSAINNTDSLSAQKKLRAAMEDEIKLLEEADQISQYDIDRANLKYELTLKQIALEEAQANKTTMKLRRDSQGNMSYVFAADQDEIAKAQQELADAENELYNFDKDAYREKTKAVLKAEQDLQNKLQEIWTNENLSEEQKLQYSTMINEQYRDIIEADISESEKVKQNLSNDTLGILVKNFDDEKAKAIETGAAEDKANRIAVEHMRDRFKGLTEESIPTLEELSKKWGDGTTIGTITGDMNEGTRKLVESIQNNFDTGMSGITSKFAGRNGDPDNPSFVEAIEKAMKDCETASTNFQSTVNGVAIAAGVDIDTLKGKTDGLKGSTGSLKDTLLLLVGANGDYITKVSGPGGSLSAAQNLADKYKNQHTEVSNINSAMKTYLADLDSMKAKAEAAAKAAKELAAAVKIQADAQAAANNGPSGVGNAGTTNTPTENSGGGGGGSYTPPEPAPAPEPETYHIQKGDTLWDITGGDWNKINDICQANGISDPNKIYAGKDLIIPYDTGGYTGDWHSSEGKIAMLHEKEIVLNKMDTKNILDIVSMVREMTSSSLRGANGMMSGIMEALASVTNNSTNNNQNVHITAEFPNVRVASEIEEAFNNLTNIASQHAFQY